MSLELTDKEKALVKRLQGGRYQRVQVGLTLSILHKLQAAKMKAEFAAHHYLRIHGLKFVCTSCMGGPKNPRHTWTDEQWLEAAKNEFTMENKG